MKEVKCPELPESREEQSSYSGKVIEIKCQSSIVDRLFCDTFVHGQGYKKTCKAYKLFSEKDIEPVSKTDKIEW